MLRCGCYFDRHRKSIDLTAGRESDATSGKNESGAEVSESRVNEPVVWSSPVRHVFYRREFSASARHKLLNVGKGRKKVKKSLE